MATLYVGTEGAKIIIEMGTDISGATVLKMRVTKPDGSAATWPTAGNCSLEGTTAMSYTVVADDLAGAGDYRIHPYIEEGDWKGSGDMVVLSIYTEFER